MIATKIIVSQFHGSREVTQVVCNSTEEAAKTISEGNAIAARGWHWGLSATNFVRDDGSEMSVDKANEIRRDCGCNEY